MSSLRIDQARLISPDLDLQASLLVEQGKIAGICPAGEPLPEAFKQAEEVLDASAHWLLPGFIDIHSHGANDFDTCDGSLEAIEGIAAAKAREGVSTWLPTTLTLPFEALEPAFRSVAEYQQAAQGVSVPGIHLEGPYINAEAAGAQNPEFVRVFDAIEVERLHQIAPILIASLAPEMPGAKEACSWLRARGIMPSAAHTKAGLAELEAAMAQGLGHLTHFCNQMTPLHHREIGVVGAGLLHEGLMVEMISDGIHLVDEMITLLWKLIDPSRLMLITDSMRASWLADGQKTQLGGLPVVVENGAARLENGALAGSTARFFELFARVLKLTTLPPDRVVAATSWNQARSLGLLDRGKLQAGLRADLVLLNPENLEPVKTWVAGKLVHDGDLN